jgi:UDP-glucose:(heptosyl)LPS alpha-1,3-glucosyltransferase
MKLAFIIFKYFPYGGVQRDMLRIAMDCKALGHKVTIYTSDWSGPLVDGLKVVQFKSQGWFNHLKYDRLIKTIEDEIKQSDYDLVVGFNRMPGLDVYFAADSCFLERAYQTRPWWYRFTPRFSWFSRMEKSIFSVQSKTHILTLTKAEQDIFQRWYATPSNRFHLIPPFISESRFGHFNELNNVERSGLRSQLRAEFGFNGEDLVLLLVGSGFKTKGADRAVTTLDSLPTKLKAKVKLIIVGQDDAGSIKKLIASLKLTSQVIVLPGRDDIPYLMSASDVLIHPARYELAGHVLLEAMACGLTVITTDKCGYASYIEEAQAGVVLKSPFDQKELNQVLIRTLENERVDYQNSGACFARKIMKDNPGKAEATILSAISINEDI